MTISALYIYPIKSLGGIAVSNVVVEPKGFQHDRRFMLVSPTHDGGGIFITQRTNHQMALIDVAIDKANGHLRVWHRNDPVNVLTLPLTPVVDTLMPVPVSIWDSENVPAVRVSDEADRWFSDALGKPCHLVYMPEATHRTVDPAYARPTDAVSFADGYPYLLIGQASLDDLNQRLPDPIGMERFRPNIVVEGSLPYEEDSWQQFSVGELDFSGVKPCARCVLTTINPATGERGPEPLRTLTTYRQYKHKILFGQNVLLTDVNATGTLRVGDTVAVLNRVDPWLTVTSPA